MRIVERTVDGWLEVRVDALEDRFVESTVPAVGELVKVADEVASGAVVPPGARLPCPVDLRDWLARAATVLTHGEIALLDYMAPVDDSSLGECTGGCARTGITAVAPTRSTRPGRRTSRSTFRWSTCVPRQRACGLSIEVDVSQADVAPLARHRRAGRRRATRMWNERAHIGDLAAVEARSRVQEADALLDPSGLGAHRVCPAEVVAGK